MTRMMYDGVEADEVPAGAAIYAGYVDGAWQSYAPLTTAHPSALHVSICVTAAGTARVLDVENGDATPEQAPTWAERQRADGNPYPVVYMDQANWLLVRNQFADQAIPEPLYWVAAYVADPTKPPTLPADALAVQFYDFGGYDASVVADYWPGVDPAPLPIIAAAAALEEEDEMTTTSVAGRAGLSWAAGTKHVVQVGYDPAGGNPILRVVMVLTTGPLVLTEAWKLQEGLGTGVYELPVAHVPACRGVILEWASGSAQVTYDATAV